MFSVIFTVVSFPRIYFIRMYVYICIEKINNYTKRERETKGIR